MGILFNSFRFRITANRGSDPKLSPDLNAFSLEFQKILDPKWGWQANIDLARDYDGKSPAQMKAALEASHRKGTLATLVYRRQNMAGEQTLYVDLERLSLSEETGNNEQANAVVLMVEV